MRPNVAELSLARSRNLAPESRAPPALGGAQILIVGICVVSPQREGGGQAGFLAGQLFLGMVNGLLHFHFIFTFP